MDDGCIKRWPIVEGSLTPAPAEPRRTDARVIKSAYDLLGLDTERLCLRDEEAVWQQTHRPNAKRKTGAKMTQNEMIPVDDLERAPRKRLPVSNSDAVKANITVGSPFDSLDALDMLHGYVLLRSAKNFHGVSERYANALTYKVRQKNLSAMKADELSRSTLAGFGDEWVPDLWSAQIWNKARLENVILPLFQSVEMPSNPFELPIEGSGTLYGIALRICRELGIDD
jgi:hypothetical protein